MAKRKSLDLIVLLMISVFVITASALVYYSLPMVSSTTITATVVAFKQGADWDDSWTMGTNNTYCSLALKAYPNATLILDDGNK